MASSLLEGKDRDDVNSLRGFIRYRGKKYIEDGKLPTKAPGKGMIKKSPKGEKFVLTAYDESRESMMNIEEYCIHYNLPIKDITTYKLITHTGTPYFNIQFKSTTLIEEVDLINVITEAIDTLYKDKPKKSDKVITNEQDAEFTRLIYTDTHIAMDTNAEATAMYAVEWNEKSLEKTLDRMIEEVKANKVGNTLIIDDLGDTLDGWNGQTTRGGHPLPQNMTNKEAFRVALSFKLGLLEGVVDLFDEVICNNICNDNHSGDFGAILNHAFATVVAASYNTVAINNYHEFIGHYIVGNHAFILSHGKDKKSLKFGFKPILDVKQIEKIDHYLKFHGIYSKAKFIEFSKGDSHQFIMDFSTSQDFDYFSYPALSPSSEWVQTNFKRGDRGFVIQQINKYKKNKKYIPIIL